MKVWIVTFGDAHHGFPVRGVYSTRDGAVKSLQEHADTHFECFGGSRAVVLLARGANLWSGFGKVAQIAELELEP